ncbi:hypothetical protein MNBD_GAMMA09-1907 [hydrothermal vent metagenome]|uniref:Uncharacterized protein n=1 Tax=hydrothermal vent metagenome TaxID=652676 RepID=A0A3B0Y029_9ZZZZ
MAEHIIEIKSEQYLYNNEEIAFEDIPSDAEYVCYRLNSNNEAEYFEMRRGSITYRLMSICNDDDHNGRCQAILAHAVANGMESENTIELGIILNPDEFELQIPVSETEQWSPIARFTATNLAFEGLDSEISFEGYMVEVSVTEPMQLVTKRVYYNDGREIINIEYVMYSINDEKLLDTRFSFPEVSALGKAFMQEIYGTPKFEEGDLDADEGKFYLPICDQAYLDEVSSYINFDLVAHVDFDGNIISDEEMMDAEAMYQRSFYRQWFNAEQQLKMNQVILMQGVAHTEIYDVPQDSHLQTVHAYLRKTHRNIELISLDYARATHYVVMYEPISYESTDAVPLVDGEYKRNSSIYSTLHSDEGITQIINECVVFGSDNQAIKKLFFGKPGELSLMYEEVFKFDENGQSLESEMIHHI